MNKIPDRAPNCMKCAHYKITWDKAFPRACDVFGFKGTNLPSHEVFRATGSHCPSFIEKKGLKVN